MDAIEITDPRLPTSFRDKVVVDELTGCWAWCGPTIGARKVPSFRRRPALSWLWDLLAAPNDVRFDGPLHQAPTTCGHPMCLNMYHRLFDSVPEFVHALHRCPTCRQWCGASLAQHGVTDVPE